MSEVEFLEIFADNLASIMSEVGISRNQIAKEIGVDRRTIYRLLSGEQMPSAKTLVNLVYTLECDFDDLVPTYDVIR